VSANPETKKTVSITGALSSSPSAPLTKEDRKLLALRFLESFQQSASSVAFALKNRVDAQVTVTDRRAIERKYSDDQPRDDHGRFADGSGSRESSPEKWVSSLTAAEKTAFRVWSGDASAIREYEATGKDTPDGYYKTQAEALQSALDRGVIYSSDIHRGLTNLSAQETSKLAKVGTEIKLDASSSFSTNRGQAKAFAYEKVAKGKQWIVLSVKQNDIGVNIAPVSRFPNESEVVVPKGISYRVTDVEKTVGGPKKIPGYILSIERI